MREFLLGTQIQWLQTPTDTIWVVSDQRSKLLTLKEFPLKLILEVFVCSAGADVLSQAQDEASVLYEATSAGDPAVISLLLEYGADANVSKHTGHLPIHRVAHRGHLQ